MSDIQAAEARTPASPLRAILSGVGCAVAAAVLLLFEIVGLVSFEPVPSQILLAALFVVNLFAVGLIVFYVSAFDWRRLAAGAFIGSCVMAGALAAFLAFALPDKLSGEFGRLSGTPRSAPRPDLWPDVPRKRPRNSVPPVAQDAGPKINPLSPFEQRRLPGDTRSSFPQDTQIGASTGTWVPPFDHLGTGVTPWGGPAIQPGKPPVIADIRGGKSNWLFPDSGELPTIQKHPKTFQFPADKPAAPAQPSAGSAGASGPGGGGGGPGSGGGAGAPGGGQSPYKTAAAEDQPANSSAYWNSWFVDGGGPASNNLIANTTYILTLDISAFNYSSLREKTQSSATKVDKTINRIVADTSTPEVILTLKPMVPEGSGLRLADNKNSYVLKVDLEKLRHPDGAAAKQYADGKISINQLSAQSSAGAIQVAVTAESKGCATIAFAVFKGLLPLDHLVQRVSIGETQTSAPVCDDADPKQSNALSGGLDSLREVGLGMEGSGASVTAAAALHIFDFDSYSMAVFVDGRPGKNQTVYGWQTASSVVEFLKADFFQNDVLKARHDSADKKQGAYVRAAQELAKVVFSTKPGQSTENDAKNALAALRAIAKDSPTSPVVVVRVASDVAGGQNRSIYVPLGILGAKGDGAVLEHPIIVVQPMALQRYPSRDKCIGDWTFAVPNTLEKVSDAVIFPAKVPGPRILDIDKLREYFAAPRAAPIQLLNSPATVGLVVLAHQDEGVMWFGESTNHIMPQDIERHFPLGSVGIFAACSAASAKGRNAALLQRLNEQGLDTLIASPFTIDAGYGVVFASSFAEVVEAVSPNEPPPTILELFDRAIALTAKKFKDKTEGEYSELGLEYVLLGNPAIRLCVPKP